MISETDLLWWCCLNNCQALTEIKSVCDIGLQELFCKVLDNYDKVTGQFVRLCGEPYVSLADCHGSADMWRRLKREIVSLDLVGNDMSLVRFDLNNDSVPAGLRDHFDFVTNVGTTEHIFNQANCFKVIHDLAKVGGIMAHALPFAGFENHGFFSYTMKFFTQIAKENGYECLDAWVSKDLAAAQFKPDAAEFFTDRVGMFKNARSGNNHPIDHYNLTYNDYYSTDACIYVFLRKVQSAEFVIPGDLPYDYEATT